MMCPVIDANTSDDAPGAPHNEGGVLANLPRTRPQRSSPRRAAARSAAGAANGASGPQASRDPSAKTDAKPAEKTVGRTAGKASAGTGGESSAAASRGGVASAKRRPSGPRKQAPTPEDAAPRQGFECDSETASGSVQPPGSAELMATAAEIVGELAKAGLSTGERLLKDVVSRLPLS